MPRAHFADVLLGSSATGTLTLLSGATVHVYDQGTTNHIAQTIYTSDGGSGTLTNPFATDATGLVDLWLATAARVDLAISKTGFASVTRTVDVENAPV